MNRKERRAAAYSERREVCLAMTAAADIGHYEVAADIGHRSGLDICPVCVSKACNYAQRVTWHEAIFWICETCAQRYALPRDRSHPVPLADPERLRVYLAWFEGVTRKDSAV